MQMYYAYHIKVSSSALVDTYYSESDAMAALHVIYCNTDPKDVQVFAEPIPESFAALFSSYELD